MVIKGLQERFPGKLIVIEGIDGTGKSTLARGLYERLRREGFSAVHTFEPTDGRWGRRLRESFAAPVRLSPQEELDLFQKDRLEHVRDVLLPALKEGRIIVCDRYYFSTMAYQGARGLDPESIRKANEEFAPRPDVVLLLRLSAEEALVRIRKSRGETPNNFEKLSYLKEVAAIFDCLKDPFVVGLDAKLQPQRLLELAFTKVLALLGDAIGNARRAAS